MVRMWEVIRRRQKAGRRDVWAAVAEEGRRAEAALQARLLEIDGEADPVRAAHLLRVERERADARAREFLTDAVGAGGPPEGWAIPLAHAGLVRQASAYVARYRDHRPGIDEVVLLLALRATLARDALADGADPIAARRAGALYRRFRLLFQQMDAASGGPVPSPTLRAPGRR